MNKTPETVTASRPLMNGKPVFTVPAKSVINFDSGFKHKLLCDGPTFSAGSACAFSCTYCYVPDMMRKLRAIPMMAHVKGAHEDIVIQRENALAVMTRQLTDAKGRPKFNTPEHQGRVIYGSPLVDVAANMTLAKETVELVATLLELTTFHVRLLSKSPLLKVVAKDLAARRGDSRARVIFGLSTGTLDDKLARAFEPDSGLVSQRIKTLHWLQDEGFRTFGMICPSLPQADYFHFANSMASALRADRCEHVWAEVMNVRGESFTRTFAALNAAGCLHDARRLAHFMGDKELWEQYARRTFDAHSGILPAGKLRFLQYVSAGTRDWWNARRHIGAVIL